VAGQLRRRDRHLEVLGGAAQRPARLHDAPGPPRAVPVEVELDTIVFTRSPSAHSAPVVSMTCSNWAVGRP
jgi:hypothetical protein